MPTGDAGLRPNYKIALALAVGIALVAAPWLLRHGVLPRASPLVEGLPREFSAANTAFDLRVRRQFPVGTPQSQLIETLARQGFREGSGSATEDEMIRNRTSLVCNLAARVYWRANAAGAIQSVRGVYREEGCL